MDALAACVDRVRGEALAIALGANLPGPAGEPLDTLIAVRPLIADLLEGWASQVVQVRWSPLYRTAPAGGPVGQPDYLNAVLLVSRVGPPRLDRALGLLEQLQQLEQHFGRVRVERWGPRCLDLDLLWWAGFQCDLPSLTLPHPFWRERGFVLAPLQALMCGQRGGEVFNTRVPDLPTPLPGRPGWPE